MITLSYDQWASPHRLRRTSWNRQDKRLASPRAELGAAYLRIDAIEQAIKAAGTSDVGASGYAVANALSEANLKLGGVVIADCVNPVAASRQGWSDVPLARPQD